MRVVSVNTSPARDILYRGASFRTGIFKAAVAGPVRLFKDHVEGDEQADRRVHGGVDMAAYAYPIEHYAFWQQEIARPEMPFGQFGENLTISGLTEDTVRIGDILKLGSATVQVSEPRIPCFKLVARMEAGVNFSARFHKSRKLGFYLRVLEEGEVGAGDAITVIEVAEASPTVAEFIAVSQFATRDIEALRRIQRARGLSAKWIATLQKHIDRAAPRAAVPAVASVPGEEVVFAKSGITVRWDGEARHLLGLAERAGLNPGFGCRSGSCQTCICAVLEGEIGSSRAPPGPCSCAARDRAAAGWCSTFRIRAGRAASGSAACPPPASDTR